MDGLQTILKCKIGVPSFEKSREDGCGHLVRVTICIGSETKDEQMLLHIQALKNGHGWELHDPTLKKFLSQVQEAGFDPDSFNMSLLRCHIKRHLVQTIEADS